MKKATDEIVEKIKSVDLIIEVLDTRAISVSSNPELIRIAQNKPILRIALKSDLADNFQLAHPIENLLIGNLKNHSFKDKILKQMDLALAAKIKSFQHKGLINYQFLVMVIGIPNVGKSSLINYLAPKKTLKTENRAGVTKTQTTRKINQNYFLIDTPGILVKKISTIEEAYQLSIINCISKKILPMHDVIKYCFEYFSQHYNLQMQKFFGFLIPSEFLAFMDAVCSEYMLKTKNGEYDYERGYELLFTYFSDASIAKFHFN